MGDGDKVNRDTKKKQEKNEMKKKVRKNERKENKKIIEENRAKQNSGYLRSGHNGNILTQICLVRLLDIYFRSIRVSAAVKAA